jgi:hypothetical protein
LNSTFVLPHHPQQALQQRLGKMKIFSATLLAATTMLQVAHSDFIVYTANSGGSGLVYNTRGYQVYDGDANCGNILQWKYSYEEDVSGKPGVQCKGKDCPGGNPADIEQLEMNFGAHHISKSLKHNQDDENEVETYMHHVAYYKDRGGALVDMDGRQAGTCEPFEGAEYWCSDKVGNRFEGKRMFRCKSFLTVGDLRPGT